VRVGVHAGVTAHFARTRDAFVCEVVPQGSPPVTIDQVFVAALNARARGTSVLPREVRAHVECMARGVQPPCGWLSLSCCRPARRFASLPPLHDPLVLHGMECT
jgi:hypothetical protein